MQRSLASFGVVFYSPKPCFQAPTRVNRTAGRGEPVLSLRHPSSNTSRWSKQTAVSAPIVSSTSYSRELGRAFKPLLTQIAWLRTENGPCVSATSFRHFALQQANGRVGACRFFDVVFYGLKRFFLALDINDSPARRQVLHVAPRGSCSLLRATAQVRVQ